jgi:hypothetical protein
VKVEFRNSGDQACESCGATDLIATSRGDALEIDLTGFIGAQVRLVETVLLAQFKEERMSLEQVVKDEQRRVKETVEAAHAEYEQAVDAALQKRAPFFRLFKRQWQKKLEIEVEQITLELREKTARV